MRGHIRGPGRPLVLRLLPRGARDQPGGARPPRPGEAQSGQWDPDWGRGETRATGRGSKRHAQVGDGIKWPHVTCEVNQVIQRK